MNDKMKETWDSQNIPEEFKNELETLSASAKRLKSNALFSNLKRWMYVELAIGLAATYLVLKISPQIPKPEFAIIPMIFLMAVNFNYYFRFLQKAELVLAKDTRSALESMIKLLKDFIRRIIIGTLILMPPFMVLIIYSKITFNDGLTIWTAPPSLLLVVLLVSFIITALHLLFIIKVIFPISYRKWLNEYEELYKGLTT